MPRSKNAKPKHPRKKDAVKRPRKRAPVARPKGLAVPAAGKAASTSGTANSVGRATEAAAGLPVELSGDVARRVWLETEPRLRDRLNLLDIDERILVLYCNCWQLLTECQDVLRRKGRYVTMEDTGYVSRHPAAVDEKNTIAQIRQLAAELGMTPKSGRRVKVRSGDGDALKAFLAARPGDR